MYKSKLQELCQRCSWELPEYKTIRGGLDHIPRFTASVTVRGQVFESPAPAQCKSSKEAQNTAARVAFEHFTTPPPAQAHSSPGTPSASAAISIQPKETPPATPATPLPELQPVAAATELLPLSPVPSSLPFPPPGFLVPKTANSTIARADIPQKNGNDTEQASMVYNEAISSSDKHRKDNLHIYKNQLQQFALKKNLGLPVYTTESEGPPHARRFKSSVSVGGKSYVTTKFFTTLKEAEQVVAKVACQELLVNVTPEGGGLYKHFLQELAHKRDLPRPTYETVQLSSIPVSLFGSTVMVGTQTFQGTDAKTKKQAEMNAARVAYSALTESHTATEYLRMTSISVCEDAESSSHNIQASKTTGNHQDATAEAQLQAKRAKHLLPKPNANGETRPPLSPGGNFFTPESSLNPKSVTDGKPVEEQSGHRSRIVVYPRKSNMPKPESSTVLPFSDEDWVAYKVA